MSSYFATTSSLVGYDESQIRNPQERWCPLRELRQANLDTMGGRDWSAHLRSLVYQMHMNQLQVLPLWITLCCNLWKIEARTWFGKGGKEWWRRSLGGPLGQSCVEGGGLWWREEGGVVYNQMVHFGKHQRWLWLDARRYLIERHVNDWLGEVRRGNLNAVKDAKAVHDVWVPSWLKTPLFLVPGMILHPGKKGRTSTLHMQRPLLKVKTTSTHYSNQMRRKLFEEDQEVCREEIPCSTTWADLFPNQILCHPKGGDRQCHSRLEDCFPYWQNMSGLYCSVYPPWTHSYT